MRDNEPNTHEVQQDDGKKVQSALLIGVSDEETPPALAQNHLEELERLVDTMGVAVAGSLVARIGRVQPQLYIGSGKAEEIKMLAQELRADVLIFDISLSPSQQRNWEKLTEIAVIDREEVILDIFAGRAQTREAVLQVGLARMQYHLPRLKRAWTHLERQRNAGGARGGGGELQLEVDRRIVLDRIARFRRELANVRRQRQTQRAARTRRPVPGCAIVGYTNAGKSSLLKRMTGADVFIEDKLFATLDTTTRRIELDGHQPLLLTDTVGFIRKLPHQLVESFKATLEEAVLADFLLHVVDVSSPDALEQYEVTEKVLEELGSQAKLTFLVLNKMDAEHDAHMPVHLRARNIRCFEVSAHTGEGIPALLAAMGREFIVEQTRAVYCFPASRYDLVSMIHREGKVHAERHEGNDIWIEATLPENMEHKVADFAREAMPAPEAEAAGEAEEN